MLGLQCVHTGYCSNRHLLWAQSPPRPKGDLLPDVWGTLATVWGTLHATFASRKWAVKIAQGAQVEGRIKRDQWDKKTRPAAGNTGVCCKHLDLLLRAHPLRRL